MLNHNVSVCLIKLHTKKTDGGVEVQLHAFLAELLN